MAVKKAKMEFMGSRDELSRIFTRIGEELAAGTLNIGLTPVAIAGFKSVKVSLKEELNGLKVKVAVKLPKQSKKTPGPVAESVEPEPVEPVEPVEPTGMSEEPEAGEVLKAAAAAQEPETVAAAPVEEEQAAPAPADEDRAAQAGTTDVVEAAVAMPAEEPAPEKPAAKASKAPAKTAKPAKATTGTRKPAYKSLKKRMKSPWKNLLDALAAGNLPESGALESFLADCELMLTYRGKGEPYYDAFREPMAALAAAVSAGDLGASQAAAADMERLKKACHGRYK